MTKPRTTALFHADNGRIVCRKHVGATAQTTGHDLSGQKIVRVTPADRQWWLAEMDEPMRCEDCSAKPTTEHRDAEVSDSGSLTVSRTTHTSTSLYSGTPINYERWQVTDRSAQPSGRLGGQPSRDQITALGVPADATFHSGMRCGGIQTWDYTRKLASGS